MGSHDHPAGNGLPRNAHREVVAALNARFEGVTQNAPQGLSPNFDLIPSIEGTPGICGAAVTPLAQVATLLSLCDQVDQALRGWLDFTVDWISVTVHQLAEEMHTKDDFTPLPLVRQNENAIVRWRVEAVCEHIDILRSFHEPGQCYSRPSQNLCVSGSEGVRPTLRKNTFLDCRVCNEQSTKSYGQLAC